MGGGGAFGSPVAPLDLRMGPDYVYTYWDILKTDFIVRIGFCTTLCVLSIDSQVERERERCVFFLNFVIFWLLNAYFDKQWRPRCQGLHCLLIQKPSSKKEIQFYLEIIVCDPLMYKMDQFETRRKNPLVHKGLKCQWLVNWVCCQDQLW